MSAQITLPIRPYLILLACLVVVFVTVHLGFNLYHFEVGEVPWLVLQLFDLDAENNLPTWFSGFLLLNNSLVLCVASTTAKRHRMHWMILAAGFLLLSIDEVAGLHETFHTAIDINWTLYATGIVALVGAAFIPFLITLPRSIAGWFILAGITYISGALLVEFLSRDMEEETLAYALAVAVEEGFEMIGALMFLAINLARLRSANPVVSVNLK